MSSTQTITIDAAGPFCFTKHAINQLQALHQHRLLTSSLLSSYHRRPQQHHRAQAWWEDTMYGDGDWSYDMPDMFAVALPMDVLELVERINEMPVNAAGLPSRNKMRKCGKLAGEISRKTGHLKVEKRGGKLRRWSGDERLFSARVWRWLLGEGEEEGSIAGDGEESVHTGRREKKLKARKQRAAGAGKATLEPAEDENSAGAGAEELLVGDAEGNEPLPARLSMYDRVKARRCGDA